MTKQNKYSGRNWFRLNRGSKTRHMAKSPLGKAELPWHYQQMVENFGTTMDAYHEKKIAYQEELPLVKQEEGVTYKIE
jgi:hypothetical protein